MNSCFRFTIVSFLWLTVLCQCREGKRVAECLRKALRTAGQCMDISAQVELYVEILNQYMVYYELGNEEVGLPMLHMLFLHLVNSKTPL